MKSWVAALALFMFVGIGWANCDPTHFRWECDIPVVTKPTKTKHSLIYCGNTYLYVSKAEYDCIARYQRDNINMILTVNGEHIDSPCIPAGRYGPNFF